MVKKDDSLLLDGVVKEADAKLLKEMGKLMHRIERVFVSSDSITFNPTVEKLSQLTKMVQQGKYLADVKEFSKANVLNVLSKNSELVLRKVDWSEFQKDLLQLVSNGEADYVMPNEVYEEIGREVQVHEDRLEKARKKEKLRHMQVSES
ncbi:hypothetical protein EON65_16530 [archaeon]|nr:MAG: hypothetical protein EON65_16530 [archaeon]